MLTLIKISWRNMWRNTRRTAIIMVSVFVGVWGMSAAFAYNNGFLDSMINMAIESHIGHIEIHAEGYNQDPQISLSIQDPDKLIAELDRVPGVVERARRIKTMGMLTTAREISGTMIIGIEPEPESRITMIADSMTDGEYLKGDDMRGIILGHELAEKLEVEIGDKIVLQAQGYDNEVQAIGLRVRGTFRTGTQAIDKFFACMNLSAMQEMLNMGERVSEIVILGNDAYKLQTLKPEIVAAAGISSDQTLEVLTWGEVMPELEQWLVLMDLGNYIFLVIIYMAMAFGIANTMIMAIFERIRELGILKALGTKPWQVFMLIVIEAVMLCMTGVALGLGLSYLTVLYLGHVGLDQSFISEALSSLGAHSVIYPWLSFENIWMAALLAFLMAIGASLYPAFKAARLKPVDAIRFV